MDNLKDVYCHVCEFPSVWCDRKRRRATVSAPPNDLRPIGTRPLGRIPFDAPGRSLDMNNWIRVLEIIIFNCFLLSIKSGAQSYCPGEDDYGHAYVALLFVYLIELLAAGVCASKKCLNDTCEASREAFVVEFGLSQEIWVFISYRQR